MYHKNKERKKKKVLGVFCCQNIKAAVQLSLPYGLTVSWDLAEMDRRCVSVGLLLCLAICQAAYG
jgi:hypothetical protein